MKNLYGSRSSLAWSSRCTSSTERGHAPKEPWFRYTTDGSKAKASAIPGRGMGGMG